MSKRYKIVALVLIVIVAMLALCACQQESIAGLSAYEIAVKNGFEGTEAQWLESLKGTDGKDGTDGTDGANGLNGADGQSITIDDLRELYNQEVQESGYSGSFYDFLKDKLDLTVEIPQDDSETISQCLLSAVSVNAFNSSSSSGSAGAGIVYYIDKVAGDAIFVTNYHVVYDGSNDDGVYDTIKVYLYGGECETQAITTTYVGGSMKYDLAVLSVENNDVIKNSYARQVTFADGYKVGETAIAIGNPQAEGISATSGIVSVDSEHITMSAVDGVGDGKGTITMRVMRIDTAVNSGNSGGGLFNAAGKLIGIVNAKYNSTTIDNVSYAIPVEVVRYVVENVRECGGQVKKPVIGVSIAVEDSSLAYDAEKDTYYIKEKCVVQSVTSGSLAAGKLEVGDVIQSLTINSEEYTVNRYYEMADLLLKVRQGDEIKIKLLRNGVSEEVSYSITAQDLTVFK
ncbi:MAG: S1C family serine protease [Christensenellales bacterium]